MLKWLKIFRKELPVVKQETGCNRKDEPVVVSKVCDIRMDDSSSQPVSALRCQTCGQWRSTPCERSNGGLG